MVYDDVVNPAKSGVANAKHGGGVVLTPGVQSNQYQSIDAGTLKPVSKDESKLTNRFDDIDYYMDGVNINYALSTRGPSSVTQQGDYEVSWTNINNVLTSDDSYCTSSLVVPGPETDTLRASDFDFTVPHGATINGIVVEIERYSSAANTIKDAEITIRKGTTNSNNKSTGSFWSTTEGYVSFGGASDLWGLTLTAEEVNAATFAVNVRVANESGEFGTAFIDHIRVTVYYQFT
jgi:hypothetical protein